MQLASVSICFFCFVFCSVAWDCQTAIHASVTSCLSMAFPCQRWAHLPLCTLSCTLQTSLDSFVSHPSVDKHRQEMNVVLQWFTPYWKHLLSKKSIQSSFGFTCLLFSLALEDTHLSFSWFLPQKAPYKRSFWFL